MPLTRIEKAAVHLATTERSGQVINTPIGEWKELLGILDPKSSFEHLNESDLLEAFKLAKNLITELSKEEKIDKKLRNSIQRSGKTVLPQTSPSGMWVVGVYGQLRRQQGPSQNSTTTRESSEVNSHPPADIAHAGRLPTSEQMIRDLVASHRASGDHERADSLERVGGVINHAEQLIIARERERGDAQGTTAHRGRSRENNTAGRGRGRRQRPS